MRYALNRLFFCLTLTAASVMTSIVCSSLQVSLHMTRDGFGIAHASDKKPATSSKPKRRVVKKKRPLPAAEVVTPASAPAPLGAEKSFGDGAAGGTGKPVDAILLLDSSRSMQRNDPERLRDQGARLFLQFLEKDDRFAIIDFAEEASVVNPLTLVQKSSPKEIADILDSIENEGNFTDFLGPIELALEVLETENRPGAEKVIILLSDGQMDPDPAVGDKNVRTSILLEEMIPKLVKQNIKLHSLAISKDADAKIMKTMSNKADGMSWYTHDVNTIHRIFSDLFLSIKKPQVLELTKDGFEIDSSTNEATFFINRKTKEDSVIVVDPVGKEYVNKDFPVEWKWFRGDLFDIITIASPLPGVWMIRGGEETPSGFAKLLSNLKLEYSWAGSTLNIGDLVSLKARLTENGNLLSSPELAGLVFYTFKIINSATGQIYLQGRLSEQGDGVAEATVALNDEGEFKLFLSVTSPTFTRQAHIPFSVSRGLIALEHIPGNEFTGLADTYRVLLHPHAQKLKNIVVGLLAKSEDPNAEVKAMNITKGKVSESEYSVPLEQFSPGVYMVSAIVKGLDDSKKNITAKSEELKIVIKETQKDGHAVESEVAEVLDLAESAESEEPKEKASWPFGVAAIILSLLLGGGAARFFIKKSRAIGATSVEQRKAFEVSDELKSKIEVIRSKITSEKRPANELELEIFSVFPDLQKVLDEVSVADSKDAPDAGKVADSEELAEPEEGAGDAGSNAGGDEAAVNEEESYSKESSETLTEEESDAKVE